MSPTAPLVEICYVRDQLCDCLFVLRVGSRCDLQLPGPAAAVGQLFTVTIDGRASTKRVRHAERSVGRKHAKTARWRIWF